MLAGSVKHLSGYTGINSKSFTSQMIIKNWLALNDFNKSFVDKGMVLTVGDGIAVVYGLFNIKSGE
jgi:F0F1-type ATP synthase alpha subunit